MPLADTILSTAYKGLAAINPIKLFNKGAWRAAESTYHQQMAIAADPFKVISGISSAMYQRAKANYGMAIKNYKSGDPNIARGMSDYLSGYKLGMDKTKMAPGSLRFNSIARKTAIAGLGVYSGSALLFGDNPITKTTDMTLKAATHLSLGSLAYKLNPILGGAYGAVSMINILRGPKDNVGPY